MQVLVCSDQVSPGALAATPLLDDAIAAFDDIGLYLVIIEGPDSGRWIELGVQPVTGGRHPPLDIVFTESEVSRLHLLVSVIDGTVVVEDLDRSTAHSSMDSASKTEPRCLSAASYASAITSSGVSGPAAVTWRARWNSSVISRGRSATSSRSCRRRFPTVLCTRIDLPAFSAARRRCVRVRATRLAYICDLPHRRLRPRRRRGHALGIGAQCDAPACAGPYGLQGSRPGARQLERNVPDGSPRRSGFTIWYGVYDALDRTLRYSSAGHHPGYLVPPDRVTALPLRTPGPMVGAKADARFRTAETSVPAGSLLYLFSDGVFEVMTDDRQWRLDDFLSLLLQPSTAGASECQRLSQAVRSISRAGSLEDDFSLLTVTFP